MSLVTQNVKDLRPYVAGKPIEEVQREFGLEKVVKLASNENPMGSSPKALEAIRRSIDDLSRYPAMGAMNIRPKLAEYFKLPIENVIAGSGSEGVMNLAMRTFLCPGENVVTSDGTFIGFYVIANACGTELRLAPLKDYKYDLDAMLGLIDEKTKFVYLANPNNPTGNYFTKNEFEKFMSEVPKDVIVIMDEAYYEYAIQYDDYPNSMDYDYDNVMTLRTFSKAYGLAAMRIGYGFAREELIGYMMKVKLTFEPGLPAQAAGGAALDDNDFLQAHLKQNAEGREYLYKLFDTYGFEYIKSATNFIMFPMQSAEAANDFAGKLLRKGVVVRPLTAFRLPHCIRVTVGLPEENEFLAEKLKEVM